MTPTLNHPKKWIFIVDNRRGRLLSTSLAPPGRHHLEVVEAIENKWEEHQHGRPSPRAGKQGNTWGHEDEEMMHRFARDVTAWLEGKAERLGIDGLTIFAPPRFLGVLRQSYSPQLAARVTEREGELGYMSPGDLARHRTIKRFLDTH